MLNSTRIENCRLGTVPRNGASKLAIKYNQYICSSMAANPDIATVTTRDHRRIMCSTLTLPCSSAAYALSRQVSGTHSHACFQIPVTYVAAGPDSRILLTNLLSTQYSAMAWMASTKRRQKVLISRFDPAQSHEDQVPQRNGQVCVPLLPTGDLLKDEPNDAGDYMISLSLDVVHGRLFCAYSSREVIILHFD